MNIIVPSRNEENNIRDCLEALENVVPEAKIIVVDRSEDSTPEIVNELAGKYGNIQLIKTSKPGKGAGLKEGFRHAEGIIVMTDADNSYPAEKIPELVDALAESEVAIGCRYCKDGKLEGVPFLRRFTGWGYSTLFRIFFGVRDPQSGLKAFKKDVFKEIGDVSENGFGWDSEFLVKAKRKKLRISEHPIVFRDKEKQSNVNVLKASWNMWWNFFELLVRLK
mgnify:CR=1 FL=1